MIDALRCFGLPDHILEVINAIYRDRCFQERDYGEVSQQRTQSSAISQDFPLSPLLAVMLMTVVMFYARAKLSAHDKELVQKDVMSDLLYADGTLLISCNAKGLERHLAAVSESGEAYGLCLHWGQAPTYDN